MLVYQRVLYVKKQETIEKILKNMKLWRWTNRRSIEVGDDDLDLLSGSYKRV